MSTSPHSARHPSKGHIELHIDSEAEEVLCLAAEANAMHRAQLEGIPGADYEAWRARLPAKQRVILAHTEIVAHRHYVDLITRLTITGTH